MLGQHRASHVHNICIPVLGTDSAPSSAICRHHRAPKSHQIQPLRYLFGHPSFQATFQQKFPIENGNTRLHLPLHLPLETLNLHSMTLDDLTHRSKH